MLDAARLGFQGFVDLVRDRMAAADSRFPKRAHRFRRDLVPDVENVPESWYRGSFDDLAGRGEPSGIRTGECSRTTRRKRATRERAR